MSLKKKNMLQQKKEGKNKTKGENGIDERWIATN